jgi:hypothetical protein
MRENYTKRKLAVASFVKSVAGYVFSCWLLSACFLVAVWLLLVASDCFWLLLVVFAFYGAEYAVEYYVRSLLWLLCSYECNLL